AVVGREGLYGFARIESLCDRGRGYPSPRQDGPTKGHPGVDDDKPRALLQFPWRRTSAERVQPDRQPVVVAFDSFQQGAKDVSHGELAGRRHVHELRLAEAEALHEEVHTVSLELLLCQRMTRPGLTRQVGHCASDGAKGDLVLVPNTGEH